VGKNPNLQGYKILKREGHQHRELPKQSRGQPKWNGMKTSRVQKGNTKKSLVVLGRVLKKKKRSADTKGLTNGAFVKLVRIQKKRTS